MTTDSYGAFMPGMTVNISGAATGPLAGTTFGVKDVFDIAGHPTSNGQPTWKDTHPVPRQHAPAVVRLLDAGATAAGKTVCDEMCYSLAGNNTHYGAPVNPAAPDRSVGGSSSGSAAAVAGQLVDFALGTDCGGSVRCPASFSGIYGIRPTHGRVDDTGVVPLAGSFDVVGWFARDPRLLAKIGSVLLDGDAAPLKPRKALIAEDAFACLSKEEHDPARRAAEGLVTDHALEASSIVIASEGLDQWFEVFRHLQGLEIRANHQAWIDEHNPDFGPGVRERFAFAATLGNEHRMKWQPLRDLIRNRLRALLEDNETVVLLPTAPMSPMRDASAAEIDAFRARAMGLTCPAGLAGVPQVTLPLAHAAAPLGISVMGPAGSDEALLQFAVTLHET